MKKEYKQLRKKLGKKYKKLQPTGIFDIAGGVKEWLELHDIKYSTKMFLLVCKIHGKAPYVYQKKDRKSILKYLKKNKSYIK